MLGTHKLPVRSMHSLQWRYLGQAFGHVSSPEFCVGPCKAFHRGCEFGARAVPLLVGRMGKQASR